jgi:copper(I)-binding protein
MRGEPSYLRVILAVAITLLATSAAVAQSSASKLEIVDPWGRAQKDGESFTAAYLEVINTGDETDTLLSATSPWAERTLLARYVHDGYNMKLSPVASVKIRAKSRVKLTASDTFIRLEKLTQEVRPGDDIPITLRFEKGGLVEVKAKVGNQLLGNMD